MNAVLDSELICAVCQDMLNNPYQYPCGHSYCLECINDISRSGLGRCPECQREIRTDHEVVRNFRLANIIDGYKRFRNNPNETGTARRRSDGFVTGRQLLYTVIAVTIFLKVLTWWMDAYLNDLQPESLEDGRPMEQTNQVQNVTRGLRTLVSLLLSCVQLPLHLSIALFEGLACLASLIHRLCSMCVTGVMYVLLPVIALFCKAFTGILSTVIFFMGLVTVIFLISELRTDENEA